MKAMIDLLPPRLPAGTTLPAFVAATGARRARVALLEGCVQRVLRPSINAATVRLLAANGAEVVIPSAQGCCGALAMHSGFEQRADRHASRNERAFPRDVDAIVTTAAGCGSAMKDRGYQAPVQDAAEFLDALGLRTPLALERATSLAYQDACHLAHGQGIRTAPRRLLQQIYNATLIEIAEADLCCGSAGLYNLEHPQTARALAQRKAAAIVASGAGLAVTGNVGCLSQLAPRLPIPVRHTMEVLNSAYSAATATSWRSR
jgi:glycolate oxidase iron-sulfur subunit